MKQFAGRIAALMITASLAAAGMVYAQEAQETQAIVFGEADENATAFQFVNNTGKEIVRFYITDQAEQDLEKARATALQEALIEKKVLDDVADGSIGPKTKAAILQFRQENGLSAEEVIDDAMLALLLADYADGNLLKEDEVIKPEETFTVNYQAEEQEAVENQRATNPAFLVKFILDGEDTEYVLHYIPLDGSESSILIEDGIAYVEYAPADNSGTVSTLEAEKALIQTAPQPQESYYAAPDYSYEDTQDYGYYEDYSYSDYQDYSDDYYYADDYSGYDAGYTEDYSDVQEYAPQGADGCIDTDQAMYNP